ncbi:MAG: helix-turn-helix domain-containing protein [Planctomycetota bacterium]|nr:helix-turn-helix domain-containing protein [Planctomycetota bacterium]
MVRAVTKRQSSKRRPRRSRVDWPQTGAATIDEAAEFLNVSRFTVYRGLKNGVIQKIDPPISGDIRISWEFLHAWLRGRSQTA